MRTADKFHCRSENFKVPHWQLEDQKDLQVPQKNQCQKFKHPCTGAPNTPEETLNTSGSVLLLIKGPSELSGCIMCELQFHRVENASSVYSDNFLENFVQVCCIYKK